MTPSPITGATGNREFFLHLRCAVAPDGLAGSAPPALLLTQMTSTPVVSRVGIVAKHHLRAGRAASGRYLGLAAATRPAMPSSKRRRPRSAPSVRLAASGKGGAGQGSGHGAGARRRRHAARHGRSHRRGGPGHSDSRRQLRQPRIPDRSDAARALPVARIGGHRTAPESKSGSCCGRRRCAEARRSRDTSP